MSRRAKPGRRERKRRAIARARYFDQAIWCIHSDGRKTLLGWAHHGFTLRPASPADLDPVAEDIKARPSFNLSFEV